MESGSKVSRPSPATSGSTSMGARATTGPSTIAAKKSATTSSAASGVIQRVKVAIVGAGPAGLGCAYKLLETKTLEPGELVVLEARNRTGGRCHTVRMGETAVADAGASFVHNVVGNPLWDVIDKAGLKLSSNEGFWTGSVWDEHGRDITEEFQRVEHLFEEVEDELTDRMEALTDRERTRDKDQDANTTMNALLNQEYLHRKQALISSKVDPGAKAETKHESAGYDTFGDFQMDARTFDLCWEAKGAIWAGDRATPWKKVSTLGFFDVKHHPYSDDQTVMNGYSTLINFLAKGVDVKLEHVVTAITPIQHGSGAGEAKKAGTTDVVPATGVLVTTTKGVVYADFVVVAIPLGVLKAKSVHFAPPLPSWKTAAIGALHFGIANKVVVRFKECFWNSRIDWLCYAQPLDSNQFPGEFAWIQNFHRFNQDPILVGFVENYFARDFSELSDEQQLDHLLRLLEKRYGKQVHELYVDGFVTRWERDEFSRGSWSWPAVGALADDFDTLAKPVWSGRLRFAGEHTSRALHSTVSGAYASGVREAHAIARTLRKQGHSKKLRPKNQSI